MVLRNADAKRGNESNESINYVFRKKEMRKFSSLKAILYLLALIPLAFTWGLVVHNAKEREENAVAEILNNAYRLAKYAALEESEYFADVYRDLGALSDLYATEGDGAENAKVLAASFLRRNEGYLEIGGAKRDGSLLFTTNPASGGENFADRDRLAQVMENRSDGKGHYHWDNRDGNPSVVLSKPLFGEEDETVAVFFAVLDVKRLDRHIFPTGLDAPEGSRIIQTSQHGDVLAYDSGNRSWISESTLDDDVARLLHEGKTGIVRAENGEGSPVVYAVASVGSDLEGRGVRLAIAIPEKTVFEKPGRVFRRDIALLAVVSAAAILAVWLTGRQLIGRRLEKMMDAAQRLSNGDLGARVGKMRGRDEIGRLAEIIDGMARSLETLVRKEKEARIELGVSLERIRDLARSQWNVRERESKRIAREIHDRLGQSLSVLKMDLVWLKKRSAPDNADASGKIRAMEQIIDDSLKTLHEVCSELRPVILDDFGLAAAVEQHAEEFEKRTEIPCELNMEDENIALNKEQETAIFRIFQETLTNVLRHANATKVSISLKRRNGCVLLTVADNGVGIEQAKIDDRKSFGLIGIRERLYQWNGTARFFGEKGKGTRVEIEIAEENPEESIHD